MKHGGIIRRTVKQALEKYRDEVAPAHRGARWEKIRCDKLARTLPFANRPLPELRSRDVADWRDAALAGDPAAEVKPLAPASVRREMGLLRLVLERCRLEWGWLAANPMDGVKRPQSPRPRDRVATQVEIDAVLAAAPYARGTVPVAPAQRIAVATLFALETAMRAGEICGIRPEDIRGRHVLLRETKNGDRRAVPLSKAAVDLLALVPDGFDLTPTRLDVGFRKLRDAAGIVGLHFHDLRATALTRLSRKLDVLELARMVGHRDPRSLMIYFRPHADDLAERLD